MKKLLLLLLLVPSVSMSHDYDWIAPAFVGRVILGSSIYNPPVERKVVIYERPNYWELERRERIREELQEREALLYRRNHTFYHEEYYERW